MKAVKALLLAALVAALLALSGCGGSGTATETTTEETPQTAPETTTAAPIDPSKFYSGVQVLKTAGGNSEYSVVWAARDSLTDEDIKDWLTNYVKANSHNYDVIVYPETEENGTAQGVYAQGFFAQKDVTFSVDQYGQYMLADESNATTITSE